MVRSEISEVKMECNEKGQKSLKLKWNSMVNF